MEEGKSLSRFGAVGVAHWSPKPGLEIIRGFESLNRCQVLCACVAEWLGPGLQIRFMQVRILSRTP